MTEQLIQPGEILMMKDIIGNIRQVVGKIRVYTGNIKAMNIPSDNNGSNRGNFLSFGLRDINRSRIQSG